MNSFGYKDNKRSQIFERAQLFFRHKDHKSIKYDEHNEYQQLQYSSEYNRVYEKDNLLQDYDYTSTPIEKIQNILFYDYFITPIATFQSKKTVLNWIKKENCTLVVYDKTKGNCHIFVIKKNE